MRFPLAHILRVSLPFSLKLGDRLDTLVAGGLALTDVNGDKITKDHYLKVMRTEKNKQKKQEWAAKVNKKAKGGYLAAFDVDKSKGEKRQCMHDAAANAAKRVGAQIDIKQLLREVPLRGKETNYSINEIVTAPCVASALDFEYVSLSHIKGGKEAALMSIEDGGVYFVLAQVDGATAEYHAFVYDSTGTVPFDKPHSGLVIDNRKKAPIFLIEDSDRASVKSKRKVLNDFFKARTFVLQVYRVTKKAADSVSVPAVNYPSAAYQDAVAATKEQHAVAAKKATEADAQGIVDYKRKQREEGKATGEYDLVGDSKTAEIDLTAPPPAKKSKVAPKALEDMSVDELQAEFKAKLGRTQVTGSRARDKGWLIGRINGVPTIRAKRAQGKQGGGGGKRARTAK
jgi:hypothetical protein